MNPVVPSPDPRVEPEGFVVVLDPDRIHFLDWGEPPAPIGPDGRPSRPPAVLLVHGLAGTAWAWAPVARRLAGVAHLVAMDLRGHGLSDAPTDGYDPDTFADDAVAVAEGSGLLDGTRPLVIAGHGFGGSVAAWAAARLGERCRGLVLVDGGWTDLPAATGMAPDEWLRGIEEPPEVYRSMAAFLADRVGFDPASWDADQERAARASVVEVPAGHVVSNTRPHVVARTVEALFAYRPDVVLPSVAAPITALLNRADELAVEGLAEAQSALARAERPPMGVLDLGPVGHNLMRYRPDAVAGAILAAATGTMRG